MYDLLDLGIVSVNVAQDIDIIKDVKWCMEI